MLWTAIVAQDFLGLHCIGGAVALLIGALGGFRFLGLLLLAIREGAWDRKAYARPTAPPSAASQSAPVDASES